MSAIKVLRQALADGLTLIPAGDGTLRVRGPAEARARHLPAIKEYKADLLRLLTDPRRLWHITEPDGAAWRSCYAPPQTWAEVLSRYASGTEAAPVEDPDQGEPLPADIEAAVLAWLDRIGEGDPQARAEALNLARNRPDIAQGYRDRANPQRRAGGNPC